MLKILFVCLGNICRSPAAEAIMNHLLEENGLSNQVRCDSAGLTTTFLGKPADKTMRDVASERGYQITSISRPVTPHDLEQFDMVLAMDSAVLEELRDIDFQQAHTKKLHNITEFCEYMPDTDVPDPYLGDSEEFEFVIDLLEDACNGVLNVVKKQIN